MRLMLTSSDDRRAPGLARLAAQVRRWHQASSLGWRDEDIMEVTRYLNGRFYGFTPGNTTGLLKSSVPSPSAAGPSSVARSGRP